MDLEQELEEIIAVFSDVYSIMEISEYNIPLSKIIFKGQNPSRVLSYNSHPTEWYTIEINYSQGSVKEWIIFEDHAHKLSVIHKDRGKIVSCSDKETIKSFLETSIDHITYQQYDILFCATADNVAVFSEEDMKQLKDYFTTYFCEYKYVTSLFYISAFQFIKNPNCNISQ